MRKNSEFSGQYACEKPKCRKAIEELMLKGYSLWEIAFGELEDFKMAKKPPLIMSSHMKGQAKVMICEHLGLRKRMKDGETGYSK
jgi:hypothetical protein